MNLRDFRVLSFDCYGTLIDWETGILAALAPLSSRALNERTGASRRDRDTHGSPVTSLDRDTVLEAFGRTESRLEAEQPTMLYTDLLTEVYRELADEWDVSVKSGEADAFGSSVGDWPAFADAREALNRLGQRYTLVILSNVDRASFSRSRKRLGADFDFVFAAEDIGSYKPSLRNFEFMVARLAEAGFGRDEILHTAQSLFHDHMPANEIGLHSAWINRQAGRAGATPEPATMPRIDFEFPTLAAMADAAGN